MLSHINVQTRSTMMRPTVWCYAVKLRTLHNAFSIKSAASRRCTSQKDHFRLFRFLKQAQPSAPDSAISIEVRTFKIYRAPSYEAISYCWGEKPDGVVVIQSRHDHNLSPKTTSPFEVWINLHGCLRRIWSEQHSDAAAVAQPSPWFWNDAICIEQGDHPAAVKEKEQQIGLMKTIFQLTQSVRVWLGDASLEEENVLMSLAATCADLKAKKTKIAESEGELPPRTDISWLYWSQIILRPWFNRLWIVQEALIGGYGNVIVTLGTTAKTDWEIFHEIIERTRGWVEEPMKYERLDDRAKRTIDRDFLLDWGMTLETYIDRDPGHHRDDALRNCVMRSLVNIKELMFLERYHDTKFGFLQQMIKVFGNRKCLYDQDRPNAMKGLLTDDLKKNWKYHPSDADLVTVYREVTRLLLTNDPTLSLLQRILPKREFLGRSGSADTKHKELVKPSWVVDLGDVVLEAVGAGISNRVDGFHAGLIKSNNVRGKSEWTIPRQNLLNKLINSSSNVSFPSDLECHITGVLIGTVGSVSTIDRRKIARVETSTFSPSSSPTFGGWIHDSYNLIKTVIENDSHAKEVHWRSLVMNMTDAHRPEVVTMFDVNDIHSRSLEYEQLMNSVGCSTGEREGQPRGVSTATPEHGVRPNDPARQYVEAVYLSMYSFPNWFATTSGHLGRLLAIPKERDVVAVFYGAATPFLLRPVEGGHDVYEFMGEVYVHGVMQGEALLKPNEKKFPKKTFKLV